MTRKSEDICAQCKNLTGKGARDQWGAGKGRCTGYDGSLAQLSNPIVDWNTRACVMFEKDRDPERCEAREQWIEKQKAKTEGAKCNELD